MRGGILRRVALRHRTILREDNLVLPKTQTEETNGKREINHRDCVPVDEYDLAVSYPLTTKGDAVDQRAGELSSSNAEGLWRFSSLPEAAADALCFQRLNPQAEDRRPVP